MDVTVTNDLVTLGLDHQPWLQNELFGNQLWRYAVFFLYVLAAVFLSKLADVFLSHWLRRLAARTATKWDDRVLDLLHKPMRLVVFLFFLHVGIGVMQVDDWLQVYLRRGFGVAVAVVITYVLIRLVDVSHEVLRDRILRHDSRRNVSILILFRKAMKVFIVVTAVLVTADNIGIKVTGVLASLGVTGLAVALASQEALSNLLGSIVVLADRPFILGDRIRIGADEGVVEYIGVRSTRLRTAENDIITLPNRNFTTMPVRNFTKLPPQPAAT